MNGLALIAVGIACFTLLLLLGGMWKQDRNEQRQLVRELNARGTEAASRLMGGMN